MAPEVDPHLQTLEAIDQWHERYGFAPSVRDLCWFLGDVATSTMQTRLRVLHRQKLIEPLTNPRTGKNVGFTVRG